MVSRAEARRRRKDALRRREQAGETIHRPQTPANTDSPSRPRSEAPTDYAARQPGWVRGERGKPWVRLDMIGVLHRAKHITDSEEQAARLFQELRTAYVSELGVRGYGSCLADNLHAYKSDDGRAEIIAEYRRVEHRVGKPMVAVLVNEVFKEAHQRPHIIGLLKAALAKVANA